jgi:acid phosphatase
MVRRLPVLGTAVLVLATALTLGGGTPAPMAQPTAEQSPASPPRSAPAGVPAFGHVFVIVMENKEYGSVIGSRNAVYLNRLANQYALATRFFAATHPSLPNYLALSGGSTFGIRSDCINCFVNADNLADQIEASGRTWKAYLEGMPAPCFLGDAGRYAQKHNPWVYYDDIRLDPDRCRSHVVPFTRLASDLASGQVADFTWITPDLCSDTHDCPVRSGDAWLARHVPAILASPAFRHNGVLFITWDEGSSTAGCCGGAAGGHIATLVISPLARSGYRSTVMQTSYGLLRTIEEGWGLPLLNGAAAAQTATLADCFKFPSSVAAARRRS